MAWIETLSFKEATGKLRALYDHLVRPDGTVANMMRLHSLRPHTMEGHMALYSSVLHDSNNAHPRWFLKALGLWVSELNGCRYCTETHYAELCRELDDDARAAAILAAIKARDIDATPVRQAERAAMHYAQKLTERPGAVTAQDLQPLREAGMSDGEILEVNQVVAYFAYANRTAQGLGCHSEDEGSDRRGASRSA